ncbi:AraC family transcriptional regulator [Dongia sedimenti]|uniref:Helix-turn-helix domain-containing protein n=1 Tax=Dongia sedimenti TaxID=3064282 RepID=A0ABU0YSA0_9PROT|nr:helix-turn-helix domain-containing protein [Rhodospirillaceae bacterium R-7]
MPSVPIPFAVTFGLLVLFTVLARQKEEARANPAFLLLIGACAVQSLLVGLRWGYDVGQVRFLLPVVAATLPALVYASFSRLVQWAPDRPPTWLHAVPPGAIVLLLALWRAPIDFVLLAIYLGYAVALFRLARRGPDALGLVRLEGAVPAHRALHVAGAALVGSALVDVLVLLDMTWLRGTHAGEIIATANLLALIALALAATVAGRSQSPPEPVPAVPPMPAMDRAPEDAAADAEILAVIDALMQEKRIYQDADLNLNRLARRAGIPARRISMAINRRHGKNVSQYINDHRIAEACRRLAASDAPVTAIMFESGFQTKSNFNREFRRVTGLSPRDWRARPAGAG